MNTYILHLETATKVCSVALSNKGKLVALQEMTEAGFAHGENLTLLIESVLSEAGISTDSLAAVSISSGPGSYTGLRIGVSTAKGLCYALKIPLIAVDSLLAIQQLAQKKYPNQRIAPMIDARRMEVFCAIYDTDASLLKPIEANIIDADSLQEYEPFVACGDGAEKLREIWHDRPITIASEILSSAVGQVEIAYQKYEQKAFEDVAYFEPFYLKDFIVHSKKTT